MVNILTTNTTRQTASAAAEVRSWGGLAAIKARLCSASFANKFRKCTQNPTALNLCRRTCVVAVVVAAADVPAVVELISRLFALPFFHQPCSKNAKNNEFTSWQPWCNSNNNTNTNSCVCVCVCVSHNHNNQHGGFSMSITFGQWPSGSSTTRATVKTTWNTITTT